MGRHRVGTFWFLNPMVWIAHFRGQRLRRYLEATRQPPRY